jgi:hypothetical protein
VYNNRVIAEKSVLYSVRAEWLLKKTVGAIQSIEGWQSVVLCKGGWRRHGPIVE